MDMFLCLIVSKRQLDLLKDNTVRDIKDIKGTQMDSKNQENHLKKYDEKSLEKLQSRVVFTNPEYLFIFKKTEKIVAALYLVTNLILDNEPIKWRIRKMALELVSDTLDLRRLPSVQAKPTVSGIITSISEMISLLKVASISEQVSQMNFAVLQRELAFLMGNLESAHSDIIGGSDSFLSQDYFNVPEPISALVNNSLGAMFSNVAGGGYSHKGQYRTSVLKKDNIVNQELKDNVKDNRHERMLQLLKVGKPLGIKDFAKEITDCSEKTIQRELLAMVGSGVLKKTGERRWSLYSLA